MSARPEETPAVEQAPEVDDDRWLDAAIEAELELSPAGETEEKAKRHIVVRIGVILLGTVVLLLGVAMLALPGPGLLVVALGLGLLATEVPWAQRLLDKVTDRLPKDADGKLPRSTIVTMVLLAGAGIAASLWFTLGR